MKTFAQLWQLDYVIKTVALRLPTADNPALVASYAEEVRRRILHYTHLNDMPDGLLSVWVSMVIDLLCCHQAANETVFGDGAESKAAGVKSITEGDTRVEFGSNAATTAANAGGGTAQTLIDSIVNNYAYDLHRYRRVRW